METINLSKYLVELSMQSVPLCKYFRVHGLSKQQFLKK